MKHPPLLVVTYLAALAALAPAASSQVASFTSEPPSYLRGMLAEGNDLVDAQRGDFDGDGRVDVAVCGTDGTLGILFAHGERQHAMQIVLEHDETDDVIPIERIAVLTRDDGHDSLYVATPVDVRLLDFESSDEEPSVTTVLAQPATALHYGHQVGHAWGCLWLALPAAGSTPERLLPVIVSPSTGLVVLSLTAIDVTTGIGETCLVDLEDDGLFEAAVATSSGVVVLDGTGTPQSASVRAVTGSSASTDRLTTLVDTDGTQQVAWSERSGTTGKLHVIGAGTPQVFAYTAGASGAIVGLRVDSDGLADIVLPGSANDSIRVLYAQASGNRYTPGSGDGSAALHEDAVLSPDARRAVAVDLERDGDEDLVFVSGEQVIQMRNKRVDHQAFWPNLEDSLDPDHIDNGVATLVFAPPQYSGYDVARGRVFVQASTDGRMVRVVSPVQLNDVTTSSGQFTFQFTLPSAAGASRAIWYFEVEMVDLGTGGAPDVVWPSHVVALSTDQEGWILERLVPGTEADRLWVVPVYEWNISEGNGTFGSSGAPHIPRLPPPPMPPPPQ